MTNRTVHLRRASPALLFLLLCLAALNVSAASQTPSVADDGAVAGDLRFHELTSRIFSNKRKLRVLVPPGYDAEPTRKYPVLYLNDGQNLFDAATSVYDPLEWKVDETVRDLLAAGEIEPLIVVGIDNAGRRGRANEYLPWEDRFLDPPQPDPQGALYPDFLTDEVMPFIEQRYRVRKGPAQTGLGGASYGGLITLYAALKKPRVFGRLLLESPSFYVSDARVLDEYGRAGRPPHRVYLGVGTNEAGRPECGGGDVSDEAVRDVRRLERILKKKGLGEDRLKVFVEECAVHDETAWAGRLPAALKFLYGPGKSGSRAN